MLEQVKNAIRGYFASEDKQRDTVEVLDALRLKEEREYYNYLIDVLNVETIEPIITRQDNITDHPLAHYIKGTHLKLSDSFCAHILKTCREVMEFLGVESIPVEFYVMIDPSFNAFSYYNSENDDPHYIVFTTGLINNFSREELKSTIGHELAHIIFKHYKIGMVASNMFDTENPSPYGFIKGIFFFWRFLAQLSADRVGLLAAKNFDAEINAVLKLTTGLNMKKVNTTSNHYMKMMEEVIKELKKINEWDAVSCHPADPVRTRAMEIFFNSDARRHFMEKREFLEDQRLIEETTRLLESMRFKPTEETIDPEFEFLLSSGYMIMTSEETWDEDKYMCLLDLLSFKRFIDPREFVNDVIKNDRTHTMFEGSLNRIMEDKKSDTSSIFSRLAPLIARDRRIRDAEVKTLLTIAEKLNIHEARVLDMILEGIRNNFRLIFNL